MWKISPDALHILIFPFLSKKIWHCVALMVPTTLLLLYKTSGWKGNPLLVTVPTKDPFFVGGREEVVGSLISPPRIYSILSGSPRTVTLWRNINLDTKKSILVKTEDLLINEMLWIFITFGAKIKTFTIFYGHDKKLTFLAQCVTYICLVHLFITPCWCNTE